MTSSGDVVRIIERRLDDIDRFVSSDLSITELRRVQRLLEEVQRNFESIRDSINDSFKRYTISDRIDRLVQTMSGALQTTNSPSVTMSNSGTLPRNRTGRRGAPEVAMDKQNLEHLLSMGFSVRQIASHGLLGEKVHRNTIYMFMKKNNMDSQKNRFSGAPDSVVKEKIIELNKLYPNSGYREMVSLLRSQYPPMIIQRERVRTMLAEVDPVGTANRWAQTVKRRVYSVPTPNSLWHIDSNHKIIRSA